MRCDQVELLWSDPGHVYYVPKFGSLSYCIHIWQEGFEAHTRDLHEITGATRNERRYSILTCTATGICSYRKVENDIEIWLAPHKITSNGKVWVVFIELHENKTGLQYTKVKASINMPCRYLAQTEYVNDKQDHDEQFYGTVPFRFPLTSL